MISRTRVSCDTLLLSTRGREVETHLKCPAEQGEQASDAPLEEVPAAQSVQLDAPAAEANVKAGQSGQTKEPSPENAPALHLLHSVAVTANNFHQGGGVFYAPPSCYHPQSP